MPETANRPLIGITGRRRKAAQVSGFAHSLAHLDVDLFVNDFTTDVFAAGGLPVLVPLDPEPALYVHALDGLIFTGGSDVEPDHYEAEPDGAGAYEPERDASELALIGRALEGGLPILGVCRGLQVLNVATGGTLHQDVPVHSRYDVDPADPIHSVTFDEHSRLRLLYGETTEVNSLHHQTVDTIGRDLVVTGRADDGTVEGIEMPGRDVLAVQWHPEFRPKREPVFDWLIKRAQSRLGTP